MLDVTKRSCDRLRVRETEPLLPVPRCFSMPLLALLPFAGQLETMYCRPVK